MTLVNGSIKDTPELHPATAGSTMTRTEPEEFKPLSEDEMVSLRQAGLKTAREAQARNRYIPESRRF